MARKCLIISGIFFLIIILNMTLVLGDSWIETYTAIIAPNGHFKSMDNYLYEGDKLKVEVVVTVGGPIDVYIMTEEQYNLAYVINNGSAVAISYLKGQENSKNIEFTYTLPKIENEDIYSTSNYLDSVYIVIDNRNCTLTNYDADSIGKVEVTLNFEITRATSSDIEALDQIGLLCFGVVVIIIIVVIFVIFYFIRESRRNANQAMRAQQAQITAAAPTITAQPQYPQYPPPQYPQVTPQSYPHYPAYQYQYQYPYYYPPQQQPPPWPPYAPPPPPQHPYPPATERVRSSGKKSKPSQTHIQKKKTIKKPAMKTENHKL